MGIVGCGAISYAHGRAAEEVPDAEFVACCDVRSEAAQRWASEFDCAGMYADFEEMIRRERLDTVVLATWPNQHCDQIRRCLDAGVKNILCEKALALDTREAVEIYEMVRRAQAFLLEGFTYLHHPRMRRLAQLIATGDWGAVDTVHAAFSIFDPEVPDSEASSRPWQQRPECGGGVPHDYTAYCVNACTWLARARATRVHATGRRSPVYGTINRLHGVIEYANGVIGLIESDKQSNRQDLLVTFTDAIVDVCAGCWDPNGHSEYVIEVRRDARLDTRQTIRSPGASRFTHQLRHFVQVIRGAEQSLLPVSHSVVNTCIVEALIKSVECREAVDVIVPPPVAAAFDPTA